MGHNPKAPKKHLGTVTPASRKGVDALLTYLKDATAQARAELRILEFELENVDKYLTPSDCAELVLSSPVAFVRQKGLLVALSGNQCIGEVPNEVARVIEDAYKSQSIVAGIISKVAPELRPCSIMVRVGIE